MKLPLYARLRGRHHLTLVAVSLAVGIVGTLANIANTTTYLLHGPSHSTIVLSPQAQSVASQQQQQAAAGNTQAAHSNLRAEPPQASAPATLKADAKLTPPGQPSIPVHVPLATVNQPGCRTLLVRNYSSRLGAPIELGVLHQTISPDDGWNGVLGNVRWFDTPAAQASSNYIVARSGGQCAYIVPETQKAWAQAGFNRVALSIEVTETGKEGSYLPPGPGRNRVIQLMIAWHHRWKLPYQHGIVNKSTCTVVKPGFVEHIDLGPCGGGHFDDSPYSIDPLIAEAAAKDRPRPTAAHLKLAALHRSVHARLRARHCTAHPKRGDCQRLYRLNLRYHAELRRTP